MKILIVTPFKENVGGVEVITADLASALSKEHEVEYLTTDGFNANYLEKILIKVLGLPYITSSRYKKLSSKPDLVIANGEFAFGIRHPKLINYFHGSYHAFSNELKSSISIRSRIALKWRSIIQEKGISERKIIAVSSYLSNVLKERGAKDIKIICNPLDLTMFKPSMVRKEYEFLFIGRYDYWGKGFDVLEKNPQIKNKILVISDNKNHSLSDVTYIHRPDRKAIPELMNKSKILFFPSRFESFGQVPAEALASGLPILMRETGLGVELKKHIPEFIVEDFDNNELVQNKINTLLNNYESYSQKARNFAENNFSKELYEKQWLKLVKEI
jgi:glycosyltransferase involved in cell wall biosynthesis